MASINLEDPVCSGDKYTKLWLGCTVPLIAAAPRVAVDQYDSLDMYQTGLCYANVLFLFF